MEKIRSAGFNERRCIARDSLRLYGSIVTVGTYTSKEAKHLSKETLYRALKKCVSLQPVLSTVIRDSDTEQPLLFRPTSIDLTNHVYFQSSVSDDKKTLQPFLEHIHDQPLSNYESQPQWRVYVQSFDSANSGQQVRIAFASSHALADGASGFVFHRMFLVALRNMDSLSFDSDAIFKPHNESKLLPPLEKAANFTISWSFLLAPLLSEFLPPWLARWLGLGAEANDSTSVDRAWIGASTRPDRPATKQHPPTAVELVPVAPELLGRVLKECRQHSARLTGLLNHLTVRALARALHKRGENYGKFSVETALDLRRIVPEFEGQMANFVSASYEIISVSDEESGSGTEDDWRRVQDSTRGLAEASNTLADQPIALLKYLSKFREWVLKNATSPAKAAFGMSNLGNFSTGTTPDVSDWHVTDMVFSQSADATNAPFNVNVASAKNGFLWIVLSWWPGMLGVQDERSLMREVCEGISTDLKAIADAS